MTDELISKTDVVKIVKSALSPASSLTNVARARRQMLDQIYELESKPEPHWIPVEQDTPDEERECWITPKTTSKVYRGIFTRHYGECHRTGFICDDGFMWLNTALAWMYCEVPEPYKGVTE